MAHTDMSRLEKINYAEGHHQKKYGPWEKDTCVACDVEGTVARTNAWCGVYVCSNCQSYAQGYNDAINIIEDKIKVINTQTISKVWVVFKTCVNHEFIETNSFRGIFSTEEEAIAFAKAQRDDIYPIESYDIEPYAIKPALKNVKCPSCECGFQINSMVNTGICPKCKRYGEVKNG